MSKRKSYKIRIKKLMTSTIIFAIIFVLAYFFERTDYNLEKIENNTDELEKITYSNLVDIPDYSGEICVKINNNKPNFKEEDYTTKTFEIYSELDYLGRCGVAYANICKEIMPPKGDERGDISSVRPTGWKQTKFNGEYLYNRCHLIAHSLADEDTNKQNLITGTRYFNIYGMLPIERKIIKYMNENEGNHVLYRVTPVFKEENLLATGVEMEAYSIEDNGKLSFNVFIYNIQPEAHIDYTTGKLLNN